MNVYEIIILVLNGIAMVLDIITTDKTEKQGISEKNDILTFLFGKTVQMWQLGLVYLVFFSFLIYALYNYGTIITFAAIMPVIYNTYRFINNRKVIKEAGYEVI